MGYWIEPGVSQDPGGFRTIMAYTGVNHTTRVNYYSNPAVILPLTGTPTGLPTANNAAVLLLNRFRMAAIGNESSATCRPGLTTSTTVATAATTPSTEPAGVTTEAGGRNTSDDGPIIQHGYKCMFTVYINSTWRIWNLDDTEKCRRVSQILGKEGQVAADGT